jgi:hypothetical protein
VVEREGTDLPKSEDESEHVLYALLAVVGAWLMFALGPAGAHSVYGTQPTSNFWLFSITLPFSVLYVVLPVIGVGWAMITVVRRWSPYRSLTPNQVVVLVLAIVIAFIGVFASLYIQASHDSRGACFGRPITKLDAVYFALGTLTTAGTGDLHVKTQQCIALDTIQLGLGMVLLAIVIAGLVSRLMSDN